MTYSPTPDVIDRLAGIQPGDALDAIRAHRPQARLHAQQSYIALFEPTAPAPGEPTQFSLAQRFAVAVFVAGLHGEADLVDFYAQGLSRQAGAQSLRDVVAAEAVEAAVRGPYGRFPAGPLSAEDLPGPRHAVSQGHRAVLGDRLSAALVHAHLLVLHPRDAEASHLQALLDAGWSTTDIVTLSQLVAFLSFQIRVVAGLQALAAASAPSTLVAADTAVA